MSIKESWELIEKELARYETNASFNAPASKSSIADFEKEFSLKLSEQLIESLLIHDGETVHGNSPFPWAFCSLNQIGETIKMQQQILGLETRRELYLDSIPAGCIRNDIDWSVKWIPVMSSEAGEIICDFDPAEKGHVGQVIFCPPIPCGIPRKVLTKDYAALLAKLAEVVSDPQTKAEYGQIEMSTAEF